MKQTFGLIILAAVAFTPVSSFAATYAFVNTQGTLEVVTAENSQLALRSAKNIAPRSGVILITPQSKLFTLVTPQPFSIPVNIKADFATSTVTQ